MGNMLWVIQRDFLQGESASDLVHRVLTPVSNPSGSKDIDALNQIRNSLRRVAGNSTGVSLTQPHADRSRLCDLDESDLDPKYIRQRNTLRKAVREMAKPKVLNGSPLTGRRLASLLRKIVGLLNDQPLPNASLLIEAFNKDVIASILATFRGDLVNRTTPLPVSSLVLNATVHSLRVAAESNARNAVLGDSTSVGHAVLTLLKEGLDREIYVRQSENFVASAQICSSREVGCEEVFDAVTSGAMARFVPSLSYFDAKYDRCRRRFDDACVGPAADEFRSRLETAHRKARDQFLKDYHDALRSVLAVFFLAVGII
eukprot:CAMPEP_0175058528 /NCGR_PEP_ID=MMETSP0052_2-20121109/11896_1 /TAXON_ID=51329 ORGANISM="Polytomella parva, Strain SAG 63-3" /NCGR_SAMPLE_ID=MMETSP0052_2 /ASSEMBLY_ACC=CAM_ASM_000194 /LENGTH=314 /DNA_ID=CAMNT_0016323915 /DNA_START=232 /DNA_END=1176 /DNA_ORIENTATION=+